MVMAIVLSKQGGLMDSALLMEVASDAGFLGVQSQQWRLGQGCAKGTVGGDDAAWKDAKAVQHQRRCFAKRTVVGDGAVLKIAATVLPAGLMFAAHMVEANAVSWRGVTV
eukprot:TRINITY_DN4804_c0_g1_i3.p2 TRINITY_DN4804_c0_g1~~TRINITY_DN4804_c0_g1_i3.p2  ORF type:complete len:110 (-),score=25.69 TRINITY_DN4804_c0_g1_i3:83-412(-)